MRSPIGDVDPVDLRCPRAPSRSRDHDAFPGVRRIRATDPVCMIGDQ